MYGISNVRLFPPFFEEKIPAGYPSFLEASSQSELNLHDFLVNKPASTFFIRVSGDSMIGAGIFDADLLIVDRSLNPKTGSVVIATLDGEFTVKRFVKKQNRLFLSPENPRYRPFEVKEEMDFEVWGVVTYVVHGFKT